MKKLMLALTLTFSGLALASGPTIPPIDEEPPVVGFCAVAGGLGK
jgi:hypothetical protein